MDDLLIAPARRLPGEGFAVAGSSYPEGILWPANVRRIDHVSPSQHGEFYWEDSEILVVGSTDDVIEILQDLPEQKRELIAARARERVMREHSSKRSAEEFLASVAEARAEHPEAPV